ncbi:structural protein [Teredinibacter turnerae]|uniref:structural protein n=1 Tax=Teredinibacter turnerae TaxID=2426 RepID=UPI000363DBDE|nr:structural protein [Teredinibacter turnerae]
MRAQSYLIGLVAVGALAFWGVNKMSRGIRNKNPLNIERTGDQWLGMAQDQSSDSRFVVFDHEVYGIRAAARIIKNYGLRGIDTIQEIISTWAPESENDTANYVAIVVEKTGIPPLRPISDEEIPALLAAMIVVENGNNPYSMELIAEGVRLANVS